MYRRRMGPCGVGRVIVEVTCSCYPFRQVPVWHRNGPRRPRAVIMSFQRSLVGHLLIRNPLHPYPPSPKHMTRTSQWVVPSAAPLSGHRLEHSQRAPTDCFSSQVHLHNPGGAVVGVAVGPPDESFRGLETAHPASPLYLSLRALYATLILGEG